MSISCKIKSAFTYIEWDHVVMFKKIRDEPDDKSKHIYLSLFLHCISENIVLYYTCTDLDLQM